VLVSLTEVLRRAIGGAGSVAHIKVNMYGGSVATRILSQLTVLEHGSTKENNVGVIASQHMFCVLLVTFTQKRHTQRWHKRFRVLLHFLFET
jgi:hypothetical protein